MVGRDDAVGNCRRSIGEDAAARAVPGAVCRVVGDGGPGESQRAQSQDATALVGEVVVATTTINGRAVGDGRVVECQRAVGVHGQDAEVGRAADAAAADGRTVPVNGHGAGDDRQARRAELLVVGRGQHEVAVDWQGNGVGAVDVAVGAVGTHRPGIGGAGVDDGLDQATLVVVDVGHLAVDDDDGRLGRGRLERRRGDDWPGQSQDEGGAAQADGRLAPQLPPPTAGHG